MGAALEPEEEEEEEGGEARCPAHQGRGESSNQVSSLKVEFHYILQKKLVVLTTEWLPWLQLKAQRATTLSDCAEIIMDLYSIRVKSDTKTSSRLTKTDQCQIVERFLHVKYPLNILH